MGTGNSVFKQIALVVDIENDIIVCMDVMNQYGFNLKFRKTALAINSGETKESWQGSGCRKDIGDEWKSYPYQIYEHERFFF